MWNIERTTKKSDIFARMVEEAATTRERLFLSAVYLFSERGYDRVGIRELSASVGVKESAFYNHYPSKDALLAAIFEHWAEVNRQSVVPKEDYEPVAMKGDPGALLLFLMERFRKAADTPLVHAILAIVRMRSFTDPAARKIALVSMYYVRRDCTKKALMIMQARGSIQCADLDAWVAGYYYGLIGLLDELVLLELDESDTKRLMGRIGKHMELFIGLLRPKI